MQVTKVSIGYLNFWKRHTEEFVAGTSCLGEATAKKSGPHKAGRKAWVESGDQGTLAVLIMKGRPSIAKLPPNSMFMPPVPCTGQPPVDAGHAPPPAKTTEP